MDCSPPCSSVRGLFRQEHCCHFPFQRIIPTQGLNLRLPASSALAGRFFTTELPGKPVGRGIGEAIIVRDQMKKSQLHFHYVSKYNVIEFCDQLQTRCFPCIEASRRCCTQGTSVCLAENLSSTLLFFFFLIFKFLFYIGVWRKKWQPTPAFLPGESQGQGSLVGCCLWGRTESDTTEVTQQQQQQHS